jgi:hypothetical protein
MARDTDSERRARKASKPFEDAELPSIKKSITKDASTKSKSTRAHTKNAPKTRVLIKKTVQATVNAKKKQIKGNCFP